MDSLSLLRGGSSEGFSRGPFGLQRWFVTLFLTDIWERFSFYGMAAILALYAAAPVAEGGLGLPKTHAAALFGGYLGLVFILALPGGWVGDRILGEWRATLWGAAIIAVGHYTMAVPVNGLPYLGLLLIAVGTGLLKPNMSALLSRFYGPDEEIERQAAFSLFYVSIQVSALIAPFVTGFLGETIDWHLGFAAAGVGMTFGVLQFALGHGHFQGRGDQPAQPASPQERRVVARRAGTIVTVLVILYSLDGFAGTFSILHVVALVGLSTLIVPGVSFAALVRNPALNAADRLRLRSFLWLLLSFSLFWMLVSQAGSLMILFARNSTDRELFGITVPASWLQSAVPFFILAMAPVFAWLWLRLDARFTVPAKVGAAMVMAGGSFLVMAIAAALAGNGRVTVLALLPAFFLQACGEVVIGPVLLAASAQVTPSAFTGRTIGLIWLFSALGAGLGSQIVHLSDVLGEGGYYLLFGLLAVAAGAVLFKVSRRLNRIFAEEPETADNRGKATV